MSAKPAQHASNNTDLPAEEPSAQLARLRADIDAIDDQMVDLYLRRMAAVEQVAVTKSSSDLAIAHPDREAAIIARLTAGLDPKSTARISDLYQQIFRLSKAAQSE